MVRVYAKDLLVTVTRSTLEDILYDRLQDCTLKTWESSAKYTRMHVTSTKDTGYAIDQEVIILETLKDKGLEEARRVCAPIVEKANEVDDTD